jgi:2-phosphosulfolactate phosphatase
MDLDVALVPGEARSWHDRICIVVDQLRASTTITALLDGGVAALLLSRSLSGARRLAREKGGVLIGERAGLLPPSFRHNNSPTELASVDLAGQTVVLSTSNGTAVLDSVAGSPAVLVGCLLNARASAQAAVALARLGAGSALGIVCAGQHGRFALEDAVGAGVIVERVLESATGGDAVHLDDGAIAARRLASTYQDHSQAMGTCRTAEVLRAIDAEEDIPFCSRIDGSRSVGRLEPGPPMRIERA